MDKTKNTTEQNTRYWLKVGNGYIGPYRSKSDCLTYWRISVDKSRYLTAAVYTGTVSAPEHREYTIG